MAWRLLGDKPLSKAVLSKFVNAQIYMRSSALMGLSNIDNDQTNEKVLYI